MKPRATGPFLYSPVVRRPPFILPNRARIAVWVIPNIEFFSLEETRYGELKVVPPNVAQWAVRDYGNRVGIFRIMKLLDRYGIRATVALNSDICGYYPEIIEEGCARNWEWMGHCQTNARRLNAVPPDQEYDLISTTLSTIASATGKRPVGWLGAGLQETWQTLEYLVSLGVEYVCDWVNDDQPYTMTLDDGRPIVAMPYSTEINDINAYLHRYATSGEFGAMIARHFDVLYREGAESGQVMAIALHPYLSGQPHRIDLLERALEHICSHERVWLTTGHEIVQHFLGRSSPTDS